ncbi:TPA: histidine phosphatase family protein [Enterococcus faecium]|uniref:Histidine phosphatase family protein n=1 Tax=Enterococcus faecium TaxID=1352 RepID=A0A7V7GT99_ENTFC|nr:histidine phosphatase family protein [Enterococcus faecium]KAA0692807.1 histidine phosphatase family protein [Enterococcus faecium]MBK5026269.1 histidine phosphatase family protein [Enterococcus faecium]MBK5036990.1 histidine phosphatase family protein [Enterococcus faecium]MBK5043266.1 histidine phosphatase family protein [Enterococcus faecium]MBK5066689.1 histidine phosphatase family protein [Enterococcus faecium]
MEKTLYLMRHGETLFNQQKKVQGWCDSPLTAKGIKQAQIAGEYFKKQNIKIEAAYASTSERASDTLEQVTAIPYQRVKGLKEWNFGAFEGEPEFLNPKLPYGDFFFPFGGERELDFRKRVADTIVDLVSGETHQTILMVSHGAACRQFMRNWAHTSQVDQAEKLGNCCILKFSFKEDTFQLLEIINHDFSNI